MNKTLENTLDELAKKQAEELTDAVFNAAKDGDESATDILMGAAADAGLCDVLQMRVIMTSKGMSVTTGGSRPVRAFFEDKLPGAQELVEEYAKKAVDLGTELVEKIRPLMIEHGMVMKEAEKDEEK